MPQQTAVAVENNFTKGLVTEATGLNFPENAATDTDNCTYTLIGDVMRRGGINDEDNSVPGSILRAGCAQASYKWNNVGADGQTQILAEHVGNYVYFYRSSSATVLSPLSAQLLVSLIDLRSFVALSGTFDPALECTFSDGNGYLFIYHPDCDPVYCTYTSGTITGNVITVQIRDFTGVNEFGVPVDTRPTVLTTHHNYNLINQGWISGNPWSTVSFTLITVGLGSKVFTVTSGLTVTLGTEVTIINNHPSASLPVVGPLLTGNVTAYSGTSMTINITSGATGWFGQQGNDWLIVPRDTAYLETWHTAIGNYPSNADVWWSFKNSSGVFDPATTINDTSLPSGPAKKGHVILNAFNQQRDVLSGVSVTDVTTVKRPRLGTWFQGRTWYTGVDAQQAATGDAQFTNWNENIYFSQVVITPDQFGLCYQVNDPTSEILFDLLPTDGGVITIQGCGSIYKLWPIQNGLLVFAANGVKFITGSRGIGFTANDYTITDISSVRSISGTSFVNVLGLPYFWNEEGVYSVQNQQQGGLAVTSLTYSTIDTFYNEIPMSSKRYARGDYDPINYTIQWIYRNTEATDVTERYQFNKILSYNTANKAFYPYTVTAGVNTINGINYITHPGGVTAPLPGFKYYSSKPSGPFHAVTFSEENDFETYLDWGNNFDSYFITGYKLRGQGIKKFQPQYLQIWSKVDGSDAGYKIQGVWNYSTSSSSKKWSAIQIANFGLSDYYSMLYKRHKIRGSGYALQFKVASQEGKQFDIAGWAVVDNVNTGT